MPIGKTPKPGFLSRAKGKGTFLHGTIKQYGNKEGVARKAIRRK